LALLVGPSLHARFLAQGFFVLQVLYGTSRGLQLGDALGKAGDDAPVLPVALVGLVELLA
jgi:hypothetical protein